MPINAQQQRLIDRCKSTGFGWGKFAASVEGSGNCSPAQEDTLFSMVTRISQAESRKTKPRYRNYRDCSDHDISEEEVASSGDFF